MAVIEISPYDLSVVSELFGAVLAIYLVAVALGRLLKRLFKARLGLVYQIFCIAFALYLAMVFIAPHLPVMRDLGAVAALTGAGVLVRLLDQFFWRWFFEEKHKIPIPKFIREVAAVIVLLAAVLMVLDFGYGKQIPNLLAASGVVGIVIGLALQDSLGNIIAGFALQIGRPFTVGDWLLMENQHVQAVEINWRSTRFVTNDEVQLDVPNQHIVKQIITNYHGGNSRHAMRLEIGIEYDAPPNRVKDVLARATASTNGVLSEPPPAVFLKAFGDSAITYEVRYWLNDHRLYNGISDGVRTNIWYALRRQRIKMPFPSRTVSIERSRAPVLDVQSIRQNETYDLLRNQPLFQGMEKDDLQHLIKGSLAHHYGRGEVIIREGADGASMFLLVQGEAAVTIMSKGHSTTVATLHTGDCFGEMSLLTGEARRASVVASHDCEVLEVTKPVFAELVQKDYDLLPRLSELLARRKLETEGIVKAHAAQPSVVAAMEQEYKASFLDKFRSFFEL